MNNTTSALYLDCSSGISGDMTVAALLDLGADAKVLQDALASLPLDGYRTEISYVMKSGLRACDFAVILEQDNHDHDMAYLHGHEHAHSHEHTHEDGHAHSHEHTHEDGHAHSHEHTHEDGHVQSHEHTHEDGHVQSHEHTHEDGHVQSHEHAHGDGHAHSHEHTHGRNLTDITSILRAGELTPHALELALKIFGIVAQAESQVHGKPLDEVHFHEVGAVDSIVDITAAAVCIDNLGIDRLILPSLTEGTGQVRCQHGLLPIPVPATAAIIAAHQLPLHVSPVRGELVTPTGAAIAAALRTDDALPEQFRIVRIGLGAGKRDYETAGVLRAMLIEDISEIKKTVEDGAVSGRPVLTQKADSSEDRSAQADSRMEQDRILIMETNIDDCSGEAMGFAMGQLLETGALDVFYTPIYMKKHRPAYKLSVLCAEEKRRELEAVIFRHTTAIGLRVYEADRTKLPRQILCLETPWGPADVKVCRYADEIYCYPESADIEKLSLANRISYPEMYHSVKQFAQESLSSAPSADPCDMPH